MDWEKAIGFGLWMVISDFREKKHFNTVEVSEARFQMFKERRIGKDVCIRSSNYSFQSFVSGARKITYAVLFTFIECLWLWVGEDGCVMLRLEDLSSESDYDGPQASLGG